MDLKVMFKKMIKYHERTVGTIFLLAIVFFVIIAPKFSSLVWLVIIIPILACIAFLSTFFS